MDDYVDRDARLGQCVLISGNWYYRKVTAGFRSTWGADLFAGVRSVIGSAARRGVDAYQAIQQTLRGKVVSQPG